MAPNHDPPAPPARAPRGLLRAALLTLGVVIGLVTAAAIALETPWGIRSVAGLGFGLANPWPGTRLTIGGASGGIWTGVELRGVRLLSRQGVVLTAFDTLRIQYRPRELLGAQLRIRRVLLAGPELDVTDWPVSPARENAPTGSRGLDLAVDRLEVRRGACELRTPPLGRDSLWWAREVSVRARDLRLRGKRLAGAFDTLAAAFGPSAAPRQTFDLAAHGILTGDALHGIRLSVDGDSTHFLAVGTLGAPGSDRSFAGTDLGLTLAPLAARTIRRFVPAVPEPGDLTLDARLSRAGPLLVARVVARTGRGGRLDLDARGTPSPSGPVELRAHASTTAIDVGAWTGRARGQWVLEGSFDADLRGPVRARLNGPLDLSLDGSRLGGHRFDRARFAGRFDEGRASLRADAASEGFLLRVTGSARPFADPPSCDLSQTLSIPPLGPRWVKPRPGEPTLIAGELAADLGGHGRSLGDGAGSLRVALHPEASRSPLLGDGRLDVTLADGVAHWRAELQASGGRVSLAGEIAPGRELAYRIDEGDVRDVDFAALLGDSTASRLDARFSAEGRGLVPATARASARIAPLALRYGSHRLEADSLTMNLADGRASVRTAARLDDASLVLRGRLARLAGPLRDADLELAFHGLDLARVTGDTSLTSRLDGRVEGSGRGLDFAALAAARKLGRGAPSSTRASLSIELDPSRWRDQQLSVCELSAKLHGSDLALEGRLESSFGRARLSGSARPFGVSPSIRIEPLTLEGLDLARLLGRPGLPTGLRGKLAMRAAARDSGSLDLGVEAALDGSRFHRVSFDRLALAAQVIDSRLAGHIQARSQTDSIDAAIEGWIPDRGRPGEPLRLAARGGVRVTDLGGLLGDSLDAGAELAFDLEAIGEPEAGLDRVRAAGRWDGRARIGQARLDTVGCTFALGGGALELSRFEVRGNVADLSAAGRIALPGGGSDDSTALNVSGRLRDVQALASLTGARTMSVGGGRFSLRASGVPASTRIAGDLTAARIVRDHSRADSLALSLEGTIRDTALAALDAHLATYTFVGVGFPPRDVDARARWDGRELAVQARADVDENRWQEIAFRFEPGSPRSRVRLERIGAMRGGSRLGLEKPCDIIMGDRFEIDSLVILQNGAPRLTANGVIESAGRADLRVVVDSLEVTDYLDLLGLGGVRGRLSGSAALTGTRERPELAASWRATLEVGKQPGRLEGSLRWAADQLDADATFVQRDDQHLSLRARLPLALTLAPRPGEESVTMRDLPVSGTLEARRFDLEWFAPLVSSRVARDIRGELDGRVEAGGDPSHPTFSGGIALNHARVQLPGLGTRYETDRMALAFAGRKVTLEPAVVRSGKGRLELSGHATSEGSGGRTFALDTRSTKLPVLNTSTASVQVSGRLGAAGRLGATRVEGTIELVNSTFYVEGGEGERRVEKVELAERDRRDLETRFSESVVTQGQANPTFLDSLHADVAVKVGAGVWVRRRSDPVLALEMSGEARARKQPGEHLKATGQLGIQTGRSYLSFLGRRFDMTRARVELPGPISEASAELEARYESSASEGASAPDVTAMVTVNSAGASIDLRSVPYMDHASLINYLTTGQTQGEMASGTATGLAVGSVLGAVGGAAGRSLGFQVVQVTQDAYGGQTLSAGNYVDPRIYLGFRQPVVQGRSTTTGNQGETYTTEFEVELEAAKRLLFNVQGGGSQYRFLLRPRLGK